MVSTTLMVLSAAAAALGVLWLVLRVVAAPRLLAQPNDRSSHANPTPTMGGISIVVVVVFYLVAQLGWSAETVDPFPLSLFSIALLSMAAIGLLDDVFTLGRLVRLLVQFLAAGLILVAFYLMDVNLVLPAWLEARSTGILPEVFTVLILIFLLVGLVWFTNLFNFMDGIDGIAAVQCLGYCLGAHVVGAFVVNGITGWPGELLWLTTGATLGFLAMNWAPAKIFMGDVGSAFLGLLIGAMVVYLWFSGSVPLVASLILLSGFWFDATYTLLMRFKTGQPITQAHRLHMYQRIAQRYGHGRTSAGLAFMLLFWLLPLALLSATWARETPVLQAGCLFVSLVPLGVLCRRYRAGIL